MWGGVLREGPGGGTDSSGFSCNALLHNEISDTERGTEEKDEHSTGGQCGKEQESYLEPKEVPVPLAQQLTLSDLVLDNLVQHCLW